LKKLAIDFSKCLTAGASHVTVNRAATLLDDDAITTSFLFKLSTSRTHPKHTNVSLSLITAFAVLVVVVVSSIVVFLLLGLRQQKK
jgi:hypothetical protein